ncbi:MAG: hypothetical protein GYB31_10515 [Bacteroidetes bacterium]|nr:hypothetical protein [Bacteroidota bacterium]
MTEPKFVAKSFGTALDNDDFKSAKSLLDANCRYSLNNEILTGNETIIDSYEKNMIAGRKKFDYLEWGKCRIEEITPNTFYIHFTDHLGHKGISHVHRCKQLIRVNNQGKISEIEHLVSPEEKKALHLFLEKVGLE